MELIKSATLALRTLHSSGRVSGIFPGVTHLLGEEPAGAGAEGRMDENQTFCQGCLDEGWDKVHSHLHRAK